jgi:hypothetical protein
MDQNARIIVDTVLVLTVYIQMVFVLVVAQTAMSSHTARTSVQQGSTVSVISLVVDAREAWLVIISMANV